MTTFPCSFLVLSPHAIGGGETVHVVNLCLLLVQNGKEVTVIVHQDVATDSDFGVRLASAGVSVIALPGLRRWPAALRVGCTRALSLHQFWRRRFDVIIANGTGGSHHWFRRFLTPNGTFIWHDHSDGLYRTCIRDVFEAAKGEAYPKRVLCSAQCADLILTGTNTAKTHLREVQRLRAPIAVIPPLLRIPTLLTSAPPRPRDRTVRIGYFGRLEPGKGIESLLRVFNELLTNDPDITLHIYGQDPHQQYATIAGNLGLSGHVHFHGPYERKNLSACMQNVDMAVMTSLAEGFGLVALEYMAHGVPFVMTDVGAARILTEDNPDAILAPLSHQGVKGAITEMVRRVRSGEVSPERLQQRYRDRHSWDVVAPKYLALFDALAQGKDKACWYAG